MVSGKVKPGPQNKRAINWREQYYSLLTLRSITPVIGNNAVTPRSHYVVQSLSM